MADSSKESSIFLLEAVLVFRRAFLCAVASVLLIAAPCALHTKSDIVIQQNRQVRLQITAENLVHLQHRLRTQLAASALVSLGRIGEAIAKHDPPFCKRGQNDLVNKLSARCEH